jgi:hypothetical protein
MESEMTKLSQLFPPFMVVEGSSGKGKTQFAFALPNALYFVFMTSESSQSVYTHFAQFGLTLVKCLEKDLKNYVESFPPEDDDILDCLHVSKLSQSHPFLTLGFLHCVANLTNEIAKSGNARRDHLCAENQSKINAKQVEVQPMTGNEFVEQTKELNLEFVVLDEASTRPVDGSGTENTHRIVLFRNLVRMVNVMPVLMGTDAVVVNMVSTSIHSREAGSRLWCLLWADLPNTNLELWKQLEPQRSLHPAWEYLLQHSRPLFTELASAVTNGDLSKMPNQQDFQEMATGLFARKRLMAEPNLGIYGQVAFHHFDSSQPSHSSGSNNGTSDAKRYTFYKEKKVELLRYHMGVLNVAKEWLYVENGFLSTKKDSKERFVPQSRFPLPENDILLYLVLGAERFLILEARALRFISARDAIEIVLRSDMERKTGWELVQNPNARSRCGNELEFIAATCMCVASRNIQGTPWSEYVANLCLELTNKELSDKVGLLAKLGEKIDFKVPFFAPGGRPWPGELFNHFDTKEYLFDQLIRTENGEQIDISSGNKQIVAECKNRTNGVSAYDLDQVLLRFSCKPDARLHFIFVSDIKASTYNLPKEFEKWHAYLIDGNGVLEQVEKTRVKVTTKTNQKVR